MEMTAALAKITGRRRVNADIPKHEQPVKEAAMSEQQSSCAAPESKSDAVEYRTIERFSGYRFGSDGSVWSRRSCEWKRLTPSRHRNGYFSITLTTSCGDREFVQLHRLILEAFNGPCPDGCEGRHFPDADKGNNAITNLSWGTPKQNQFDRRAQGTHREGARHGRAKLTADNVREARALRAEGHGVGELAKRFGVDWSTMNSAVLGKTWKCLEQLPSE